MDRRRFVFTLGAAGLGVGALAAEAFWLEPRSLDVTTHALGSTAGSQRVLTFVQVTDLHLRSIGGLHHRVAAAIRRISPDFLAFTGDSVDRAGALPLLDEFLSLLDPRLPKYAIPGNWEHWARVDFGALADVYARHGGRLLVNETALFESSAGAVSITGVDDLIGGAPDLASALRNAPEAPRRILLAHCPEHRDRLAAASERREIGGLVIGEGVDARFDLMLSGHTHGGQVSLFGWAPMVPAGTGRYVRGWFRDAGGPPLYVCRGIGTSVLPARFGSPPELAAFTLPA